MKTKSLKEQPILKQFYVYFMVASVIPLTILIYLLYQLLTLNREEISGVHLKFLIVMAGLFAVLGFLGTRSFLLKIVALSRKLKEDPPEKLSREKILELAKGDGEVAHLAKIFGDIAAKLEENVNELERTKKTLYDVLSKVGQAIASAENFDLLIQFILETTVDALGAERGAIFSLEEERNILRLKALVGFDKAKTPTEIKVGEEAIGWVAKERKPLLVPSLEKKESDSIFSPPLIATALIVHDKLLGVISLSGKKRGDNFTEDELKILSNLAYQIAVSFENAKLNTEFEKTYFETISALALAVEAKDPYSRGHSERVAEYAIKIAQVLGLSNGDISTLRDAARLHDIGKIGISDDILQKHERLSDKERSVIHKHPVIGEGIVRPLRTFQHILNAVKHHHEFLDGSGYPDGLKAKDIPILTRILTVADIFDALNSDRPYRKAFVIDEIKKEFELMTQNGKIDQSAVDALFKLMEEKKI